MHDALELLCEGCDVPWMAVSYGANCYACEKVDDIPAAGIIETHTLSTNNFKRVALVCCHCIFVIQIHYGFCRHFTHPFQTLSCPC